MRVRIGAVALATGLAGATAALAGHFLGRRKALETNKELQPFGQGALEKDIELQPSGRPGRSRQTLSRSVDDGVTSCCTDQDLRLGERELPRVLQLAALSFLSIPELARLRRVNRSWNHLCTIAASRAAHADVSRGSIGFVARHCNRLQRLDLFVRGLPADLPNRWSAGRKATESNRASELVRRNRTTLTSLSIGWLYKWVVTVPAVTSCWNLRRLSWHKQLSHAETVLLVTQCPLLEDLTLRDANWEVLLSAGLPLRRVSFGGIHMPRVTLSPGHIALLVSHKGLQEVHLRISRDANIDWVLSSLAQLPLLSALELNGSAIMMLPLHVPVPEREGEPPRFPALTTLKTDLSELPALVTGHRFESLDAPYVSVPANHLMSTFPSLTELTVSASRFGVGDDLALSVSKLTSGSWKGLKKAKLDYSDCSLLPRQLVPLHRHLSSLTQLKVVFCAAAPPSCVRQLLDDMPQLVSLAVFVPFNLPAVVPMPVAAPWEVSEPERKFPRLVHGCLEELDVMGTGFLRSQPTVGLLGGMDGAALPRLRSLRISHLSDSYNLAPLLQSCRGTLCSLELYYNPSLYCELPRGVAFPAVATCNIKGCPRLRVRP